MIYKFAIEQQQKNKSTHFKFTQRGKSLQFLNIMVNTHTKKRRKTQVQKQFVRIDV